MRNLNSIVRFKYLAVFSCVCTALVLSAQTNAPPTLPQNISEPFNTKLVGGMLAAGIGGFLAWLLTTTTVFYLTRRKLVLYLIVNINSHLRQYKDTKWLEAVKEKSIKPGVVLKRGATYTKDALHDLADVRSECLTYLNRNELLRLTKIFQRMFELEALFDGFCETLRDYKTMATPLTADDVVYLQKKHARIMSYINLLPNRIDCLSDLPPDYSGILGAEYVA